MEPISAHAKRGGGLKLRILSALVLAPLPLLAVWFGSPWFPLLMIVVAAILGWEWALLCGNGRFGRVGAAIIFVVVTAVASAALWTLWAALTIAIAGAFCVYATSRIHAEPASGWAALGPVWVGFPCVSLLWLASEDHGGRGVLLWILAVVWATDIAAYAAGRSLGGPLLAPRLSPRKTWAGLIGGVAGAALIGAATVFCTGAPAPLPLILISGALAVVEQFGDLAESMVKRRFGVKDSSGLIPGHGGLLDRLDGLLAVAPVVAFLTAASNRGILA